MVVVMVVKNGEEEDVKKVRNGYGKSVKLRSLYRFFSMGIIVIY